MLVQIYVAALFFLFSTAATHAQSQCDLHFFDRQNLQKLAESSNIDTLSKLLRQSPN